MTMTHMGVKVRVEKTTLVRIKLDAQGYTGTGHYFGVGEPLFWYAIPDGGQYIENHVRARDRESAKEIIRALYPRRRINFYV